MKVCVWGVEMSLSEYRRGEWSEEEGGGGFHHDGINLVMKEERDYKGGHTGVIFGGRDMKQVK
jgi:hypothetical protein